MILKNKSLFIDAELGILAVLIRPACILPGQVLCTTAFQEEAAIKTSTHETPTGPSSDLLKLASEIVAAYVSNNPVPASELPSMIKSVHATLGGLTTGAGAELLTSQKPA